MQWLKKWFGGAQPTRYWQDYRYLAIDLELSSLDHQSGDILSLGWVAVEPPTIRLDQRQSFVVQTQGDLGQSPAIHGLTRGDLDQGCLLNTALDALWQATTEQAETLWLFHHAPLDMAFLRQAHKHNQREFTPPRVVDTLALEHTLLKRRGQDPRVEGLSLDKCRARYGLGSHPAHDALEDALATAELFLAYCYQNFRNTPRRLSSLL